MDGIPINLSFGIVRDEEKLFCDIILMEEWYVNIMVIPLGIVITEKERT